MPLGAVAKEYIEAHSKGYTAVLEDFRSLSVFEGGKRKRFRSARQEKGQAEQAQRLRQALEDRRASTDEMGPAGLHGRCARGTSSPRSGCCRSPGLGRPASDISSGGATGRAAMRIAAIIVNWNQPALTESAVLSVKDQVDAVYVVDNGSSSCRFAHLRRLMHDHSVHLLRSESNLGFAGGNNLGFREALRASYDAIFLLNSDAIVLPDAVTQLERRLDDNSGVAAVIPTVLAMHTEEVLHVGSRLDLTTGECSWLDHGLTLREISYEPRPAGYAPGEAVLIRSSVLRECGLFDERYFCYFEDVEWSTRVRQAGWQIEVVPRAVARHIVQGSAVSHISHYFMARNRVLYLRWALGKTRLSAVRLSARPTAIQVAALVRRRAVAVALRGAIAGWFSGLLRASKS